MARVLIVGCGCRGRELATALIREGHAVRGTSRRPEALDRIAAAGAEPAVTDPDRLSTLLPQLDGVSVVCWLMGGAVGEPDAVAALHGQRLETLLERLVDTPVRGVVYEAAGDWAAQGTALVRGAAERWRIPVEIVSEDPGRHAVWLAAMSGAVGRLLSASA